MPWPRKLKIEGELKIDQNIDIKEIAKEDISISKDEALKIKFAFSVNYSNDFAKLEFEGYLITLPEKEELKQIKTVHPNIAKWIGAPCNIVDLGKKGAAKLSSSGRKMKVFEDIEVY